MIGIIDRLRKKEERREKRKVFYRGKSVFEEVVKQLLPGQDVEELFRQYRDSKLNFFEFLNGKGFSYEEIAQTIAKIYGKEYREKVEEPVVSQEEVFVGQQTRKTYSYLPLADVIIPYDEFLSHAKERRKEIRGEIQGYIYSLFERMMDVDMTDLFLEPDKTFYTVSYKELGGGRVHLEVMDKDRGRMVVNALKTMASKYSDVKVNIHTETQSGKIAVAELGLEIRIEFTPTVLGEAVSMRFFKMGGYFNVRLEELGYEKSVIEVAKKIAKMKQGMVLVSGATGSGKSTFIRSILLEADPSVRVVRAVEDPVESVIKGVTHVQVKEGQISFSDAIRSFMRANPDIIFVGEVRDPETAVALVEASMTGHLTFSTTHANTAIEGLTRVISKAEERGINSREELLSSVASSLLASFTQRLVKLTEKGRKETGRKVLPLVEMFVPDAEDRRLIEKGRILDLQEKLKKRRQDMKSKAEKVWRKGWIDDEVYESIVMRGEKRDV